MTKDINIAMSDELTTKHLEKTRTNISSGKNPPVSDFGGVLAEIQSQINFLLSKMDDEVSPEFKTLMEGYVKKANETEEFKVRFENISSTNEDLKAEIAKIRETNRNLLNELQNSREILKNLENDLSKHESAFKEKEEEYKGKVKKLTKQNLDYVNLTKDLEEEKKKFSEEVDKLRQEILDLNYNKHLKQQEAANQENNFKKEDKHELTLSHLIRHVTGENIIPKAGNSGDIKPQEKPKKKKKIWFFS